MCAIIINLIAFKQYKACTRLFCRLSLYSLPFITTVNLAHSKSENFIQAFTDRLSFFEGMASVSRILPYLDDNKISISQFIISIKKLFSLSK